MPKGIRKPRKKSNIAEAEGKPKALGLFDHLRQIREGRDPEYFAKISEADKKSWTNFMILRALSMDQDLIETVSYLYKYFDIIPPENLYKMLLRLIPPGRKWTPWIKNKTEKKNKTLLQLVADKYQISKTEASNCIDLISSYENGIDTLRSICEGYGLDEKEVDKALAGPEKEDE